MLKLMYNDYIYTHESSKFLIIAEYMHYNRKLNITTKSHISAYVYMNCIYYICMNCMYV